MDMVSEITMSALMVLVLPPTLVDTVTIWRASDILHSD